MHGMAHSNLYPSVSNHHILSSMYYPYHQSRGKEACNPFGVYLDATPTEGFLLPSPPDMTWHHSQSSRVRLLPACAQMVSTIENYEMSKKHFPSDYRIGPTENSRFQACNPIVESAKSHKAYGDFELGDVDRATVQVANSIEARDKSQRFFAANFGISPAEKGRYQLVRETETREKSQNGFKQSCEKIFSRPGEPCDAASRPRTSCLENSEVRKVHSIESHARSTKDSQFLPFFSEGGKVSKHLPVTQSPVPISVPSETLKEPGKRGGTENGTAGTHGSSTARDSVTKDVSAKQNNSGQFLKFL